MRILFLGSGAFGLPTLDSLRREHELVGVVTQPDRPFGRSQRLSPTPVGAWLDEHASRVPVIKPENVNERTVIDAVHGLRADAWVIIAFGQKLSRPLLSTHFAINLHASLLPRWRGAAPIHHAILAGDELTGNSVIDIADRMDAGGVYGQSTHSIEDTMTTGELHDLLAADGPSLIQQVLHHYEQGKATPIPQDETRVTLAPKLSRADAWIDFREPARQCARRINGLSPWPGIRVKVGETELKLVRAKPASSRGQKGEGQPGMLFPSDEGVIQCGDRAGVQLLDVQPVGGRVMSWTDFARGRQPRPGTILESLEPC